jgi:hypothetical protein
MAWLTLYHRTTAQAAKAIICGGFRDGRGRYGFDIELEGVWLSNVPLDGNDFGHLDRDTLLAVELDYAAIRDLEVVEETGDRHYREWLVPASLINARRKVRILEREDAGGYGSNQ